MSLNFIYRFQLNLHQALLDSVKLKDQIKEIYLSTVQDGNYPFILINVIKVDDKSKANISIYGLEFEVCIFSRDKNKKKLLLISELVEEALTPKNLGFGEYSIAGIKLNDLSFDEARDLVHNKLTMRYRGMLKKV